MYYYRRARTAFAVLSLSLFFFPNATLFAQVSVPAMEEKEYADLEAALASLFEEREVGNLHVFASGEVRPGPDYFFHGTELPVVFLPNLEEEWFANLPGELKAYAVFSIRGYEKPYYIIRFEGEESKSAIELFELVGQTLLHRVTLARLWCPGGQCVQEDAWVQDVNGDTFLDVLKKVRIYERDMPDKPLGEYQTLFIQNDEGAFQPDSSIPVDWADYPMERH